MLAAAGGEGVPAGQIAEELEVPPATLSFHLKELTNAGLIDQRRAGRSIIYTLNVDNMRSLFGYLMDDCCQGRPELCQPDYATPCCHDEAGRRKQGSRRKKAKK